MGDAVIFVADTHINSKLGLCCTDVYGDDGDKYEPNLIQKWLWHTWNRCITSIDNITKGYKRTIILNGDIIDLDSKHRSDQMVAQNPATVLKITDSVLEPLLKIADRLFVVRGTEAHSGPSAWSEESIANRYQAVQDKETKQYAWWQIRGIFGGVKFDVTHHASMGTLPWTYATTVMRTVQEARMEYLEWQEQAPDVIIRAHQHRYADSGTTFSTRGVYLPCWQYKTAYLYRVGRVNAKPHIGAVVFLCNNGKYELIPLLYEPIRSSTWKEI
jgi:hypothetical protein